MDGWMDAQIDGWIYIYIYTYRQIDSQIDGQIDNQIRLDLIRLDQIGQIDRKKDRQIVGTFGGYEHWSSR